MTRLATLLQPDSRASASLVNVLCAVAVVALAWQAAQVTWLIWPTPETAAPPPHAERAATTRRTDRGVDADAIAARHLFGRVSAEPAPAAAPIDAPETKLDLSLGGIYHSSVTAHSRAMIEAGGREEALYAVGDDLPGGARIAEIYPDRVILSRDDRHEALSLRREALDNDALHGRGPPRAGNEQRGGTLERYREQIRRDPGNIRRLLQPVPVRNDAGQLIGFRIQPGGDPGLFRATGLRPGDVVTAIGGRRLDSQQAAFEAMQRIAEARRITLTVQRRGGERRITLDFGN